uniref:Mandelate racemase/muconate lactonizing enzyme N-terminal domain-containing protein n=1 Tax=Romanomermis culicivorax TaxID=13658 RepID=A0A915K1X3_ROMCU
MIDVRKFENLTITKISVFDIRFPTSKTLDGSDAIHKDPDYSCAYVILETENPDLSGHGFTFTLGRGTEIVVSAVNSICPLVKNRNLVSILTDFRRFYRELTNESQLRWLGPEKGVVQLAVAAVLNGIWDLWAKVEEKVVKSARVQTDALTEQEALSK